MPGRAAQPLRTLAFWILLLLLPCLAGCGPAPARPGPEPPASGQTQSPHEETRPTEPTQPTEPIPISLLAATVTEVIDGDTACMRFEGGRTEKVRFTGVDTPETHHPTIGEEPYGREAAAFTAKNKGNKFSQGTDCLDPAAKGALKKPNTGLCESMVRMDSHGSC